MVSYREQVYNGQICGYTHMQEITCPVCGKKGRVYIVKRIRDDGSLAGYYIYVYHSWSKKHYIGKCQYNSEGRLVFIPSDKAITHGSLEPEKVDAILMMYRNDVRWLVTDDLIHNKEYDKFVEDTINKLKAIIQKRYPNSMIWAGVRDFVENKLPEAMRLLMNNPEVVNRFVGLTLDTYAEVYTKKIADILAKKNQDLALEYRKLLSKEIKKLLEKSGLIYDVVTLTPSEGETEIEYSVKEVLAKRGKIKPSGHKASNGNSTAINDYRARLNNLYFEFERVVNQALSKLNNNPDPFLESLIEEGREALERGRLDDVKGIIEEIKEYMRNLGFEI